MIQVSTPLFDGNEERYLIECIRTGWISSEGPFVKEFEEKFSSRVNRKYGIAVANGSGALDIAVEAIGIRAGDEVIMPTLTIISCITQIIRNGAQPVFVDSDPITWNMDVTQIEKRITIRTKAIMVVHIYGLPVNMEPVLSLARKYNLKIIEDAAQMHGQTCNGQICGSFGDISIFSFYSNKHITTGEGGMVVTNDEALAERCRSYRNLCFQTKKRFVHEALGWNYRMTNIQAALGLAQLETLDKHIEKKRHIGRLYNQLLKDVPYIQIPLEKTPYAENIYWVYGIVLNNNFTKNAEEIMNKLAEKEVGTRPFFYPMHLQPFFRKRGVFISERYPVAENLAERGFYMPTGLRLSDEEIYTSSMALRTILATN